MSDQFLETLLQQAHPTLRAYVAQLRRQSRDYRWRAKVAEGALERENAARIAALPPHIQALVPRDYKPVKLSEWLDKINQPK